MSLDLTTPAPPAPPALGPGAGALDRGLAILTHVATVRTCTTADLAAALDLTRSTTYRLVERLREQGWLAADPISGKLCLGPTATQLASAALGSTQLKNVAIPALHELMLTTQETVSLAIPNGHVMVFVHREQGPRPVAVSARLGAARPLHSTSVGRAYLAALPEDQRETLLQELVQSPDSPVTEETLGNLRQEIERTQDRGWSQDAREFDRSSACCGAAIYDQTGLPIAAISVAGVAERMEGILNEVGPLVRQAADVISLTLGGQPAGHKR